MGMLLPEVTELGPLTERLRPPPRAPRAPRVPNIPVAQATELFTPNMEANSGPTQGPVRRMLNSLRPQNLRQTVGDLTKASAPAALGGLAAGSINSLRQRSMEAEPAFVPPTARPGDIPIDPNGPQGPAPVAGSFLNQSEAGRNFGNAVMAVPGGAAALSAIPAGLRLLPFAGRAGQAAEVAARALPPAVAAAQGYVGGDITAPGTPSAAATAAATPTATSTSPPVTEGPTDTRHFAAAPPAANTILRAGNSYSGVNNRVGDAIVGPDGRPTSLRGSLSVLPSGGTAGPAAAGDSGEPTNQAAGGFGGDPLTSRRALDFDRDTTMSRLESVSRLGTGAEKREAIRAMTELGKQPTPFDARQEQEGKLRVQSQQNSQALRIAEMSNATQRANNENSNRTTLRGQDLELQGRMAPLQVQAQQRAMLRQITTAATTDGKYDPQRASELAAANGVDPKFFDDQVAAAQGKAKNAVGLQKDAWDDIRTGITMSVPGKEGNPEVSKAMEERAFARFKRSNPTGYDLQGEKRQRALQTAMADEELMTVFEKPEDGGFASMLPLRFDAASRKSNDIPAAEFFKGAKLGGQVGGLRGGLSPNLSKGDQMLELGDGRQSINVGNLSAGALARLEELIKQGNARPSK